MGKQTSKFCDRTHVTSIEQKSIDTKKKVNELIDSTIAELNQQRQHLLAKIDVNTQNISDWNEITTDVPGCEIFPNCEIVADLIETDDITQTTTHLYQINKSITLLNKQSSTKPYVDFIQYGMKAQHLLFAGFIRELTQKNSLPSNDDTEKLCSMFFILPRAIYIDPEENKYNYLCGEIEFVLRDNNVQSVFVDDMDHREENFPFRLIDHATHSALFRQDTKISMAINPSHTIISGLLDRLDEKNMDSIRVFRQIVTMLFEANVSRFKLKAADNDSLCLHVQKVIELGMGLSATDADSSTGSELDESTQSADNIEANIENDSDIPSVGGEDSDDDSAQSADSSAMSQANIEHGSDITSVGNNDMMFGNNDMIGKNDVNWTWLSGGCGKSTVRAAEKDIQ